LLIWFWIEREQDKAMVYSIVAFYFLLPISSLIISSIWSTRNGIKIWILPAYFGCMAMLLSYFTFSLANTIEFNNFHIPDFKMALISAIPSIVGLLIGTGLTKFNKNEH
jgi:hypothetical protein